MNGGGLASVVRLGARMRHRWQAIGIVLIAVTVAVGVSGCRRPDPTATPTTEPTDTPIEASPTPTTTPEPTEPPSSVAISPQEGPPGSQIEVSATGFPPGTEVELALAREGAAPAVSATGRTDEDGELTTTLTIPEAAEPGQSWVLSVATADGATRADSTPFEVTAPAYEPTVSLAPTSGPPGTTIQVTAEGFPPLKAVTVALGSEEAEDQVVRTVKTEDDGSVAAEVDVPASAEPGEELFVVVTEASGPVEAVSAAFEVTSKEEETTVSISPRRGPPGSGVSVSGGGFPSREPVDIGLGRAGSEPEVVATVTADRDGGVEAQVVIPASAQPGERWVVMLSAGDGAAKASSEPFVVTEAATPTPGGKVLTRTNIYLIAIGDDGRSGKAVGCGDSVVPVEVAIEPTTAPLRAALEKLLSLGVREYGDAGFYNALHASDLELETITVEDGEATIGLSGTLRLGGVCDEPRVRAQLRETALQYGTVDRVAIFINGKPLDSLLGGATPTPGAELVTRANIFLIAIGDGGQTGKAIPCGDSVVPVEVEIEPTGAPLTAALERLITLGVRQYGAAGYYNALFYSDLTLETVRIEDGEAIIELAGALGFGHSCDKERVRAQLRETALQFSTVERVSIFVDGLALEEVLGEE